MTEEETEKYLGKIKARKPRGDDGGTGGDGAGPSSGPGDSQPPKVDDAVPMEQPSQDPIPDVAVEQRPAQ